MEPNYINGRVHLLNKGKMSCGSLNENAPHHKLICLDTWAPNSTAVQEGLGSMALLEDFCH